MYYIRIEHLRVDNDYTQIYVARYLGLAREVYRRYEKGTREIPTECVVKLAQLYHTSTDYILGLTDIKTPYTAKRTASRRTLSHGFNPNYDVK